MSGSTCDAGQELLLVCGTLLPQELLLLALQLPLPPLDLIQVRAVAVFQRSCDAAGFDSQQPQKRQHSRQQHVMCHCCAAANT